MRVLASGRDRQIFGKLGSVSLNDIIQLLGMSKRTATLELRRDADSGKLYFRDGEIVHATTGSYEGEEAFVELIGWTGADFSLNDGIEDLAEESITKTTQALLLATMTTLDEVARVKSEVAAAPPKVRRRLPPRPRRRRRRSKAPMIAAAFAVLSVSAVALLLASPRARGLVGAQVLSPWTSLPVVTHPALATGRALLGVPDPWAVAESVWSEDSGTLAIAADGPAPASIGSVPRSADASSPNPPPDQSASAQTQATGGAGELTIVAEPWARVQIDGVDYGETPLAKLSLPAGVHRLQLVNDHIVGIIRDDVTVRAGEAVLKRYSFTNVGYVRLVVTPWADVSIDGRAVGQTPMGRVAVPAGSHTIRFSHPELGATDRVVRITPGQTEVVRVELGQSGPP